MSAAHNVRGGIVVEVCYDAVQKHSLLRTLIPVPAAQSYYPYHFTCAIDWSVRRYQDLLDAREHAVIAALKILPVVFQALLIRRMTRRGRHFPSREHRYDEKRYPVDVAGATMESLAAIGRGVTIVAMLLP
ncbi:hypothetical protein WM40_10050 [Robbsia andropogonis]|uniref:Fanconi-associated nuclease 1-like winged-helix domain-containing protein n=1 Tax=Robbsia andropogonis TaxID=28092 RepID=A0A0F5K0M8_9BURK|nr:hypothetical protein [Robbsia andropogonis]KKB63666.1 hypothetical protein WM40_10050 [Robbsia andropogonis]